MNFLVKINGGVNDGRQFIVENKTTWEEAGDEICTKLGLRRDDYDFLTVIQLPLTSGKEYEVKGDLDAIH
jgi:hypothetical protein